MSLALKTGILNERDLLKGGDYLVLTGSEVEEETGGVEGNDWG